MTAHISIYKSGEDLWHRGMLTDCRKCMPEHKSSGFRINDLVFVKQSSGTYTGWAVVTGTATTDPRTGVKVHTLPHDGYYDNGFEFYVKAEYLVIATQYTKPETPQEGIYMYGHIGPYKWEYSKWTVWDTDSREWVEPNADEAPPEYMTDDLQLLCNL